MAAPSLLKPAKRFKLIDCIFGFLFLKGLQRTHLWHEVFCTKRSKCKHTCRAYIQNHKNLSISGNFCVRLGKSIFIYKFLYYYANITIFLDFSGILMLYISTINTIFKTKSSIRFDNLKFNLKRSMRQSCPPYQFCRHAFKVLFSTARTVDQQFQLHS